MLRLHPLEERIVLDAALMVDLEEAGREGTRDDGSQMESAPLEGESTEGGLDSQQASFAAAALSLIDPLSASAVYNVLPDPLQYREGDGFRPVLEASQVPVLGAEEGNAVWATVSLEGASIGDDLVAPDSAAQGGFIVERSGPYGITFKASETLLAENTPAEVEELLRNTVALVAFTNAAEDPAEGARTIHVSLGNDLFETGVSRLVYLTSVNDAPTLEAGGDTNLLFTEPSDPAVRAPVALFQSGVVAMSDVDSAFIGRATVRVVDAPANTGDPLGTLDRLLVDLPADGSISSRLEFTPSVDGTTGELRLTLEGAASAETYSRLLETVRFDSLDIEPQQLSRNVRVSVVDVDDDGIPEEAVSQSVERRIAVQPTNTMPMVNLVDASFSEAVDRLRQVPLLPQLQLRDPDSANQLAGVVLILDNPGGLISDSFNVYLQGNSLFSVTRLTEGTRDTYTVLPKAPSGVAGVAEFQTFLATWTYANTSRANLDHDVGITIKAYDPQGAEGSATSKLVIIANPDAPQSAALPRPGSPDALTVAEDGQLPLPGTLFPFQDPDGDGLAGVTITTLPDQGNLVVGGRVVQAGEYLPESALTMLVYVPNPDYYGPDGFRFKVWDNSGADGGPGLSSAEQQASITVTPVNDAPLSTDDSVTTAEDTPRTLGLSDFGAYFDVENTPLAAVQITALASDGVLQFNTAPVGQPANWVAVSVGQVISATDLAAGKLRFVPDLNENGSPYATVGFKVGDGEAFSASAYTLTVNVTAVNDAPLSTDDAVTTAEDTPRTLGLSDFGAYFDVENTPLAAVQITALASDGVLQFNTAPVGQPANWVAVSVGQVISATDLAAGKLRFVPDLNENGSPYATVGFKVGDGEAFSASAYTLTVNVTAVNDAPLSTDDAVTTAEDTPRTLGLSDFGAYFDVENTPLAAVQITALASDGVLQFNTAPVGQPANWVAVSVGQVISATDLAAGKLRFVPDLNENGSPYATVGFKVGDGEAFSASAYTLTVNVTAVNDAPLSTDDAVTTAEDTPRTLGLSDFGAYFDVENTPLAAVQITALASDGVLQFNTAPVGQPANWVAVSVGQVISATDLAAGKLRFVPDLNENGSPYATVGFKVGDGEAFSASAYTLTVNVTAVNDAPLSTDDAVTTAEDTPRTLGLSDFGAYFDVENTPLAAVQITALASDGVLQFNTAPVGQPANWVAVSVGQVISATDLAAGKLRFVPDLNENGSPYATVGFKVGDGEAFSASAYTLTVNVTAVNDAPLSTDDAVTTAEDTPRTLGLSDFGAYFDVENTPLAAVQITALASDGVLQFNTAPVGQPANWVAVSVGQVISATDLAAGKLRFVPDLNENGSPYATVGFKVGDGEAFSASAYTLTVNVTAVNDAPLSTDDAVTTAEDTPRTLGLSDFGAYFDVENTPLAAVQITALASDGVLQFNTAPVGQPANWVAVSVGQVISATDLAAGKLRFVPDLNENGSPYATVGFKVGDGEAFSASAYTLTVNVTAVNDAPLSTDDAVTTAEDTPRTLGLSDFGAYFDVENTPLAAVQITALASDGVLQFNTAPVGQPANWVAVSVGQVISATDLAAGKLRFVPDLNENGSPYATVGFKVGDGEAFSASAYTLTVNVTAVNDAPLSTDDAVTTAEDTPRTLGLSDFGAYFDVENTPLAAVQITALASDGVLQFNTAPNGQPANWVAVTVGQVISATDLAAGKLRFVPDLNENGSPYATVGFKVGDGEAFSASAYTLTVNVTAVNDAPLSTDDAVTTAEDTPRTLGLSDFGAYFDVENTPLAAVQITALASDGVLQFNTAPNGQPANWVAVTVGQVISATDLAAGKLRFVPDPDGNGSPYATVGFKVGDGEAFSASAYTLTVNVTPVNDAPLSTDDAVTTAEDTPRTLGLSDFGAYFDVENTPLAAVQITALASDGVLQFNIAPNGQPASWVAVSVGQVISATDLAAGKLRFVPDPDGNGSPYATVGFKVGDGEAFSASAYTLTVNVTPVNDAPLSTDDSVTTAEDTPRTLGLSDFGAYFDVENTPLAAVQITALASDGVLQFNTAAAGQPASWVTVSVGQVISATDLAAGKLRFVPDLNENGSPYATVGFKVGDGEAFSASAYTLTVNVTPVNDAPLSTDDSVTTAEDTPRTLGLSDFGAYFDVENTPLAAVQITALASDGVLQFNIAPNGQPANWVAVTVGQVISATDLAASKLRFVPDPDGNGSPYASVGFKVGDGEAFSASTYKLTVNVTPVDDPEPILAVFASSDDGRERSEPELSPTPPLEYQSQFGYDVINYEILLEPFTYPEFDSGNEPERFLAISESFEVCTLYPLLGIGCRLVPAVVEGDYLSTTGRGTLAYATPDAPGVPPEPLTNDGTFVDAPGQPSDGFNAPLEDAFAHELADSEFVGVEPGEVVLPPGAVVVPSFPAQLPPATGEGPR